MEAFFLPSRAGQRFCIFHPPREGASSAQAALFVHAFAEEMNKSRKMAALQARSLADSGCAVLQIDLHGCGDSSGDFGDATWTTWIEDVLLATNWLRAKGYTSLWLWGHRVGCLLATQAAGQLEQPPKLLFWQPVVSGKLFLQQFLRLKLAKSLFDESASGKSHAFPPLPDRDDPVEIAGYLLAQGLASGLMQAELSPSLPPCQLTWFEVSSRSSQVPPSPHPLSQKYIDAWQDAGHHLTTTVLNGPEFWKTPEIEVCPALIQATTAAVTGRST